MCRMCEGLTLEEVNAATGASIALHGYTLQGVEGDPDGGNLPWVYTVGLLDLADHPELIVTAVDPNTSARALRAIVELIRDGVRLGVGDTIDLGIGGARVGAVHDIQYELDTFNVWHEMKRIGVIEAPALRALQIIWPGSRFCSGHQHAQPLLDNEHARVDRPRLNRAQRRRRR